MKHRYIAAAMGKAMREKAAAEGRLVETKAGIQYALETATRYMMLALWSGRGDRPACHYRVRDEAHAMQIVAAMIENAEKAAAEKASYAAAKKAQRTAMADKIPGRIAAGPSVGLRRRDERRFFRGRREEGPDRDDA